ncbi:tryptophan-rich sensory protein [Bradyrhizobium sp. MOS001]|uniref:TspO/MBR family protein n=1 Tax=unclassified Bradyrhizobium TaxID=2631580 RepID=UPI0010755718|nr:TspO/MBR family protein [Bradyrhizobium sp. MOS001]TFW52573.1 tryptophan-rich sensory protein [Bradyrhizobium sp. MOS001]
MFVIAVVGAGFAIGMLNPPGQWYAALSKPSFNPPNYIFGPVWSVIYLLIAVAGWRVWAAQGEAIGKFNWSAQMVLNFAWSPIFFTIHSTKGALIVIVAMLLTILAFIAYQWSRDRLSALLFAPYALWVSFATILNASIVILNA